VASRRGFSFPKRTPALTAGGSLSYQLLFKLATLRVLSVLGPDSFFNSPGPSVSYAQRRAGPPRKGVKKPRCPSVTGHYEHKRAGYTSRYTMQGAYETPSEAF
jgi:hypothetical protein